MMTFDVRRWMNQYDRRLQIGRAQVTIFDVFCVGGAMVEFQSISPDQ